MLYLLFLHQFCELQSLNYYWSVMTIVPQDDSPKSTITCLLCQPVQPILIFPATLRPPPGLSRPRPCRAPPASAGLPAETRPPAPTVSVSRPGRLAVGPTPVDSPVVPRRHDHAGELKINCVKSTVHANVAKKTMVLVRIMHKWLTVHTLYLMPTSLPASLS